MVGAVFRVKKRQNISPVEIQAQNQHIITLLYAAGRSKSIPPNPDSRSGDSLGLEDESAYFIRAHLWRLTQFLWDMQLEKVN